MKDEEKKALAELFKYASVLIGLTNTKQLNAMLQTFDYDGDGVHYYAEKLTSLWNKAVVVGTTIQDWEEEVKEEFNL